MKHEVFILGQTIDQRARRDGTEAKENEEREKREDWEREQRGDRERDKKTIWSEEGPERPPFIRISRSRENQILEDKAEDWERSREKRKGSRVNNLKRRIRNIDTYLCLLFTRHWVPN